MEIEPACGVPAILPPRHGSKAPASLRAALSIVIPAEGMRRWRSGDHPARAAPKVLSLWETTDDRAGTDEHECLVVGNGSLRHRRMLRDITDNEGADMNRMGLYGVLTGGLMFGTIVLILETPIPAWQVALGALLFWCLTLGFAGLWNTYLLPLMTLTVLLIIYLTMKYSWTGILPGGIMGIAIGLLTHYGWITHRRTQSESDYLKAGQEFRK